MSRQVDCSMVMLPLADGAEAHALFALKALRAARSTARTLTVSHQGDGREDTNLLCSKCS
eukprot:1352972-Amphidinium_carterae.2